MWRAACRARFRVEKGPPPSLASDGDSTAGPAGGPDHQRRLNGFGSQEQIHAVGRVCDSGSPGSGARNSEVRVTVQKPLVGTAVTACGRRPLR